MIERLVVFRGTAEARLEARRSLAADRRWLATTLAALRGTFDEVAVLATCERFEVAGVTRADACDVGAHALLRGAEVLTGAAAASHVMRVAAGLESRMVGEPQILNQVVLAAASAREAGALGPALDSLLEHAHRAGTRVRSETALGRLAGSYVIAAADRVAAKDATIGVVGSGAMAAALVDALGQRGAARVIVFARHVESARARMQGRRADVRPLSDLTRSLAELDAVITATSSPRPLLAEVDLVRGPRPIRAVDLGVPPNIERDESVVASAVVQLADLTGPAQERSTIAAAESIVADELTRFARRIAPRSVVLAAHGSGDESAANAATRRLADELRRADPATGVEAAFVLGAPSIAEALERATNDRITVIPVMTSRGYFTKHALSGAIAASTREPRQRVLVTAPVGATRRIVAAITRATLRELAELSGAAVIVVGHGTRRSTTSGDATIALARAIAIAAPGVVVRPAFLDQDPEIEAVAAEFATHPLVVVPHLLGGGDHERLDLRRRIGSRAAPTRFAPALHDLADLPRAIAELSAWHAPGRTLRVGTRGSALALRQTDIALAALRHSGHATSVVTISTSGDRDLATPLDAFDVDGPFTDDVERALADGTIDLAVHSLKDLPLRSGDDTTIAAILERGSADEALVTRDGRPLAALPRGARVGTSSARRTAQLLALRPDLVPVPIRGAVDARLAIVERGEMDAAVLAAVGIERLGVAERIAERWPIDRFVPEAGQGAIAITARVDDLPALAACAAIDHRVTRRSVELERRVAHTIEERGGRRRWAAAAHAAGDDEIGLRVRVIERGTARFADAFVSGRDADELYDRATRALELAS